MKRIFYGCDVLTCLIDLAGSASAHSVKIKDGGITWRNL